jgi:hypothetical protein
MYSNGKTPGASSRLLWDTVRCTTTIDFPIQHAPHQVLADPVAAIHGLLGVQVKARAAARHFGDQFRCPFDVIVVADGRLATAARFEEQHGVGLRFVYELPREVWGGDIDAALNFAVALPTEGKEALADRTEDVPVFGHAEAVVS